MSRYTARKMSKYGVFSGPYFPSTGKYGPKKTPYLDTFHAVKGKLKLLVNWTIILCTVYTRVV